MTCPLTPIANLIADFKHLCTIGKDPEGGWSRPAFGPEEGAAHDWFRSRARETGMTVRHSQRCQRSG